MTKNEINNYLKFDALCDEGGSGRGGTEEEGGVERGAGQRGHAQTQVLTLHHLNKKAYNQ